MSQPASVLIGESFIGDGAEAAHINTVLGQRAGPVGTAWATALATAPFPPVLALVITKAATRSLRVVRRTAASPSRRT